MSQGTVGTVKAPEPRPSLSEWTPVELGDCVTFVDSYGKDHPALVTAIHGDQDEQAMRDRYEEMAQYLETHGRESLSYTVEQFIERWGVPSVNLVYVSADESQHDSYGRQIIRPTSVGHSSTQTATGYYWKR